MTVEGCGSDSLQGDVRFAEVMGLMGAQVQWQPFSITITGASCNFVCTADIVPTVQCASSMLGQVGFSGLSLSPKWHPVQYVWPMSCYMCN